jgi:hypothetical protein
MTFRRLETIESDTLRQGRSGGTPDVMFDDPLTVQRAEDGSECEIFQSFIHRAATTYGHQPRFMIRIAASIS